MTTPKCKTCAFWKYKHCENPRSRKQGMSTCGKVLQYDNGMPFPRKMESRIVIKSRNKNLFDIYPPAGGLFVIRN